MESTILDSTDQSMESSDSVIKNAVEEQNHGVDNFDAQIGGLENGGSIGGTAHSNACSVVAIEPSDYTQDEIKMPVSDILEKSGVQNGSIDESMLKVEGGSSNGERLQLGKAPPVDSTNVAHSDHASHYSAGLQSLGNGFEMGDMVWGKVKSHPWWPGYIFSEAFATPSIRRTRRDGQFLVAFFGDSSYGWFDAVELVPYEPHFIEKSQQSTSRNFVKAVEESVDEACRRSALGLTCFCRNSNNFRPANVPGHVAVDVFDFEPGGIYSDDQVQQSRNDFQPERTLSFIGKLAAKPKKAIMTLDFVRKKATALAYRRAVFEEFDETYAQAFGHKAVRPVVAPPPTVDQSVQARLGGRLVIAEPPSGRKSSTKAIKPREQSKKDRFLFKRRDEPGDMGTSQMGLGNSSSSSSSACEDRQSTAAAEDYVFQRRDQAVLGGDQQEGATHASVDEPTSNHTPGIGVTAAGKEVGHAGPYTDGEKVVDDDMDAAKDADPPTGKSKKADLLKGASKRSNADKSDPGERKKKKRRAADSPGKQGRTIQVGAPSGAESQSKGIATGPTSPQVDFVPAGDGNDPVPAENNDGKLQQVLADLKALAVDPLHGRERNRPAIAQQLFLRFRSLVYLKSSVALPPASGDTEASEVRSARASSGGAGTSSHPPSRPPNPSGRIEDPTKGERKRVPSERQEDVAAKRVKKVSALKSAVAPTEKRKAHEMQHPERKGKGPVAATPRVGARVEPSKKMQPPKLRVEEPTFLVMKYPPGTSLPSSAELKARFARFGPMDTSQNRVFYTTNTCRILFLYKEDAESAHRSALANKSTFANVRFTLKAHGVAPDPEADKLSRESSNRAGEEMSIDHVVQPPLQALYQPSSAVQLKSCLKKPAGDEGGSQNPSGVRGARVRFNMGEARAAGAGGRVKMMDPRSNSSSNLPEVGPGASSSASSSVAMDLRSNQPEAFSKLPLQPPLVSPPQFPSVTHNHPPRVEVLPGNYPQHTYTTRLPPPPPSHAPPPRSPVDISQQMLSLLTRCNDVVTNVKSILGYVPYHPL